MPLYKGSAVQLPQSRLLKQQNQNLQQHQDNSRSINEQLDVQSCCPALCAPVALPGPAVWHCQVLAAQNPHSNQALGKEGTPSHAPCPRAAIPTQWKTFWRIPEMEVAAKRSSVKTTRTRCSHKRQQNIPSQKQKHSSFLQGHGVVYTSLRNFCALCSIPVSLKFSSSSSKGGFSSLSFHFQQQLLHIIFAVPPTRHSFETTKFQDVFQGISHSPQGI